MHCGDRRALPLTPTLFTPAPEGGGEGEEAERRTTSRRRSCPDLQQPDPPLKFSTPRLEVRSITEEQQGQRIRCCTCSHFPTIGQPARQRRAITASPPPLLCHHSENAQPPPASPGRAGGGVGVREGRPIESRWFRRKGPRAGRGEKAARSAWRGWREGVWKGGADKCSPSGPLLTSARPRAALGGAEGAGRRLFPSWPALNGEICCWNSG